MFIGHIIFCCLSSFRVFLKSLSLRVSAFFAFVESLFMCILLWGFPWWLSGKETPINAGDTGSIHRLGRSAGEGNGNPVWYSYLRNPTDRAW